MFLFHFLLFLDVLVPSWGRDVRCPVAENSLRRGGNCFDRSTVITFQFRVNRIHRAHNSIFTYLGILNLFRLDISFFGVGVSLRPIA